MASSYTRSQPSAESLCFAPREVVLMQLATAGAAEAPLASPVGELPTAQTDLADATIAEHRSVALSENSGGTSIFINNAKLSTNSSVFATSAKLSTVQGWTILITSGETYPFRVHAKAFQVMSIDGMRSPTSADKTSSPFPTPSTTHWEGRDPHPLHQLPGLVDVPLSHRRPRRQRDDEMRQHRCLNFDPPFQQD